MSKFQRVFSSPFQVYVSLWKRENELYQLLTKKMPLRAECGLLGVWLYLKCKQSLPNPRCLKPIKANPGFKINRGFNFSCIKLFFNILISLRLIIAN